MPIEYLRKLKVIISIVLVLTMVIAGGIVTPGLTSCVRTVTRSRQ